LHAAPEPLGSSRRPARPFYVLAIADQEYGTGNGGSLDISFNTAPPPPTVDMTLNPRGTVSAKTGIATLHGTYTSTDADFIDIAGSVAQSVGRIGTIRESCEIFDEGTCGGTSRQ
jgi:hypothetical protein